jgi:hypothetical protein
MDAFSHIAFVTAHLIMCGCMCHSRPVGVMVVHPWALQLHALDTACLAVVNAPVTLCRIAQPPLMDPCWPLASSTPLTLLTPRP